MRQLDTCIFTAIFLGLYGQLFMCQQDFYLLVVSQTCLGLGYGGLVLILDLSYFWEPNPFLGQYGYAGMIWFMRRKLLLLLYGLFIQLSTSFVHGLFFKRLLHRIWLQRLVNVWRRWPRSFLHGHMGDSLVSGLRLTSVFAFI
jgi:hypothetical protein